jgi:uncharacterized membrane protein YhfC
MPNVSAVAGEPLYVACPVAGYPIDSIVWHKGKWDLKTLQLSEVSLFVCHLFCEVILAVFCLLPRNTV